VKKPAHGLPVCIAALFCDQVVVGEDKMLTLVRTLDTINLPPGTSYKLGEPVEFGGSARLVILLKRGDADGRHEFPVTILGRQGDRTC